MMYLDEAIKGEMKFKGMMKSIDQPGLLKKETSINTPKVQEKQQTQKSVEKKGGRRSARPPSQMQKKASEGIKKQPSGMLPFQ